MASPLRAIRIPSTFDLSRFWPFNVPDQRSETKSQGLAMTYKLTVSNESCQKLISSDTVVTSDGKEVV